MSWAGMSKGVLFSTKMGRLLDYTPRDPEIHGPRVKAPLAGYIRKSVAPSLAERRPMDQELIKRGAPLDWELGRRRTELARVERRLAGRVQALADFKAELAEFRVRYATALARPYAELDELEARVAEAAAQLRPDDAGKRRKAERLRAIADEHTAVARPAPAPTQTGKPQAPEGLRRLYRDLTKLIHPDLASDPTERERREALMIQANAAYAEGDEATLAYLMGQRELEAQAGDDAERLLERLMRQIAQAEGRLEAPERELAEAEASDLAKLMRREAAAREEGRDLLGRFVAEVEEAQQQARKRLKALERRLAKGARAGQGEV